jgi:hypothetical protein
MYSWGIVMAHELGHAMVKLADEYRCLKCDGSFEGSGAYPYTTVLEPNLSLTAVRAAIPWAENILPSTPLPTTPDGAWSGIQLGAWEGGGYYKTGIYRSQEYCIMDGVMRPDEPFCRVCEEAIRVFLQERCSP